MSYKIKDYYCLFGTVYSDGSIISKTAVPNFDSIKKFAHYCCLPNLDYYIAPLYFEYFKVCYMKPDDFYLVVRRSFSEEEQKEFMIIYNKHKILK